MIRFSPRTAVLLVIISVAGLMMFVWPLLLHGYERVQPPFIFLALLPLMLVVLLSELAAGGIDTRMIALLGVLSAIEAVLRAISAGTSKLTSARTCLRRSRRSRSRSNVMSWRRLPRGGSPGRKGRSP